MSDTRPAPLTAEELASKHSDSSKTRILTTEELAEPTMRWGPVWITSDDPSRLRATIEAREGRILELERELDFQYGATRANELGRGLREANSRAGYHQQSDAPPGTQQDSNLQPSHSTTVLQATIIASARKFHDRYEALAPTYGYRTRRESAVAWEDLAENHRNLMLAVVADVVGPLLTQERLRREAATAIAFTEGLEASLLRHLLADLLESAEGWAAATCQEYCVHSTDDPSSCPLNDPVLGRARALGEAQR